MVDAVILFFVLGITAGPFRTELRLPAAVYGFVTVVLLLVVPEAPAVLVGIVLARGVTRSTRWGSVLREVFLAAFGTGMPPCSALVGTGTGRLLGLSVGATAVRAHGWSAAETHENPRASC